LSRIKSLLDEVKTLVKAKEWKEAGKMLTVMEDELDAEINIANRHIYEEIIKRKL
jgi:hypothetical protein